MSAQPAKMPPHEGADIQTGVITGRLLKDGRTPLVAREVTLEILRGHEVILTIPKMTDAKGAYQFKNIFQSPEFSYSISAEFEGRTYRTEFISLGEGEKGRKIDLYVGLGAEEAAPLPPPISNAPTPATTTSAGRHQRTNAQTEYKLLAVLLSLMAIGYVVWQRRKT